MNLLHGRTRSPGGLHDDLLPEGLLAVQHRQMDSHVFPESAKPMSPTPEVLPNTRQQHPTSRRQELHYQHQFLRLRTFGVELVLGQQHDGVHPGVGRIDLQAFYADYELGPVAEEDIESLQLLYVASECPQHREGGFSSA